MPQLEHDLPHPTAIEACRQAKRPLDQVRPERVLGITARVRVSVGSDTTVTLPPDALEPLRAVVKHLAAGRQVLVTGADPELTPGEVARLLGVPREQVATWVSTGVLPSHTGSHGVRVPTHALIAWRNQAAEQRSTSLQSLAVEAQALGLAYLDE